MQITSGLRGIDNHARRLGQFVPAAMHCLGSTLLLSLIATTVVAAEQNWSLRPMKRAVVSGENHPVDFFIARKLHEKNLNFSAEADRTTLLRRVTLDLTGLPPSQEVVQAFE
ncbi:DUF1549 domain-containing protein, partial [bacterium]|nr:DUF1549 domain-containing protein [bacterium]